MYHFKIKTADGIRTVPASIEENEKILTASLPASECAAAEWADFIIHENTIRAGDDGWFLLIGGHLDCPNKDFGVGTYKARHDCEHVHGKIFLPVGGCTWAGGGVFAIVTGMPYDAAQLVRVTDGCYEIGMRFQLNGMGAFEDIKIELHALPVGASYSDMAKIYRAHQLANGYLPLRERLNPALEYSVSAPNIRIRMGWKPVPCSVLEQTPETEPPMHVACTFDEVCELMEKFHETGIEKAEFCLVGWNMRGHDGRWPQILPVEESLGGEEGLRRLIARAGELGYAVTCHTNHTDAYSIADNFDENDLARNPDGSLSVQEEYWAGGRTYNICPERAVEIVKRTLPDVAALGFYGMHYIDVITCLPAKICHSPAHPVNKRQACEYLGGIFALAKELFGSVGSEASYDHTLKNCDYTLYVSFADFTNEAARHELVDRSIPFWQLVYHGIVPSNPYSRTVNSAQSDTPDDLLKVIEYGGKPQVYYYAQFVGDGKNWIGKNDFHCNTAEERADSAEKIKKMTDIYDEMAYLQYEFMEDHREMSPGVFAVTYSDGSVVTVDYNNKTYELKKA